MNIKHFLVGAALLAASTGACAEYIDNTEVTQIGVYQADTTHYVWFATSSSECVAQGGNGVLSFNESQPGGKGMLAILTSALLNKRKVAVRTTGCNIFEIYLK
ncbi:hypothetical protein [Lysobacter capsici]|uniref:hypothetical protein n=1 Tax=Lysobacter capsici TaxID=435897 RepID=UPI00287B982A|nr:hypothetical protein [Lysobacter capsici]WND78818.1 hypothetical protein RJ610_16100 [Lysobacter capsici]WND84013.1 hypothetical protein RJ609_16110 [Lysobacter capsici]